MVKEIKKESDFLKGDIWVTYEDGIKISETRQEFDLFKGTTWTTYEDGNKIAETRQEFDLFKGDILVTRDNRGNKIVESKNQSDSINVEITKTGKKRKIPLIDLTLRRERKNRSNEKSKVSSNEADYSSNETDYSSNQVDSRFCSQKRNEFGDDLYEEFLHKIHNGIQVEKDEIQRLIGCKGYLTINKRHTSQQAIDRIINSPEFFLYKGIKYSDPEYELKYQCNCCGHIWTEIWTEFGSPEEYKNCVVCCRADPNKPSLMGLYYHLKQSILKKNQFGCGKLISKKEL